ncbi:MAG TPA: hypothetical protein VEH83_05015 [Gemmatimonadales bacterium]|nr:hypothetical protein [Gemmatimonadales bacterium]
MAYIQAEVRAACTANGLGCQVRRKWSVRAKPVSESPVDDYEWKLIPEAAGNLPELAPREIDEGTYYVLSLDRRSGKFILQHDTRDTGDGPFNVRTFTEIDLRALTNAEYMRLWLRTRDAEEAARSAAPPPAGWLREFLVDLTRRFQPNMFSIT